MITEKFLQESRETIISLQNEQDKIFNELLNKIPENKKQIYEDLEGQLMDYLFNNIYYSKKDEGKFINSLYSKEILLDIDEEL